MSTAVSAVELSGLVKTFGQKRAVDNVSLAIPAGTIYGLIGPNGAGKTTTFSILAGYLRASAGRARVLGIEPHDVARLKGRVGVLPQDALLPGSERVGEFLVHLGRLQGLDRAKAEQSARDSLASVGGAEWWNNKCGKLSHGMAKRVGLAQALLGAPELVLLDEPTAGLDPKVAYQLRQFIKSLTGKCTVVVSSHNLNELEEVCSGAAILDRGRLVSAGTMAQLTGAGEEVHFELAPGPVPLDAVRALACAKRVVFDEARRNLSIAFDPSVQDAEAVIAAVLRVLLDAGSRISALAKGRGLEQRVMELT